jgi:hypothetical protein
MWVRGGLGGWEQKSVAIVCARWHFRLSSFRRWDAINMLSLTHCLLISLSLSSISLSLSLSLGLPRVHFSDPTSPLIALHRPFRRGAFEKSIFYTFHRRKWTFPLPEYRIVLSHPRALSISKGTRAPSLPWVEGHEEWCGRITIKTIRDSTAK